MNALDALVAQLGEDLIHRDPETLQTYGRDWTKVHPPRPCAVAFPRSTEQVSQLLRGCTEQGVAVVPSGGRTGLAGGAVAASGELVLSLEKLHRMDAVDPLSLTVRVQAGAITEAVHQHCEPFGLTWPVDFASKGSSQVGGNIATNAGGVRVIRYGLTRQWVLGLQVCLMDGRVLELNGALEKNNTGLDLRQLFIGTEGTLGVITAATLKLCPRPVHVRTLLLAVEGLKGALELFRHARAQRGFELLAFEYLTDRCLEAVRAEHKLRHPLSTPASAYVLLEAELPSEDARPLEAWLSERFESGGVTDGVLAGSMGEAKELWALREGISESLYRRGLLHKNDIALPVAALLEFTQQMEAMFADAYPALEIFVFGHLGDGNLHVNVLKPAAVEKEAFLQSCAAVDERLFSLVQKHGGSVSAEHGIGLLKKRALRFSRTPAELELFRGMKRVLDPRGLLNPGKIFD